MGLPDGDSLFLLLDRLVDFDATSTRDVVASVRGLPAVSGFAFWECCRFKCGGVTVAAVSGERLIDEAAILTQE